MQRTPEQIAERVLYFAKELAPTFAESWCTFFERKREKVAPNMRAADGFEERVGHECFRVMMYGAVAYAAQAAKGTSQPVDVGATRQAIHAALLAAPESLAGPASATKERVLRYHAAFKAGPKQLQAEVNKSLSGAAGLNGTPFEAVVDEVSNAAACDWLEQGRDLLKQALPKEGVGDRR